MEFSYNVLNLQTRLSKEDTQTQEPSSLTYTYLSDETKVKAKIDKGFGSGLFGIDLTKIDFGARFYAPYTARWTTSDPLASKYSSVSPYTYCVNDPVNKFDPDGKKVVFAANCSKEFQTKFAEAIHYMNEKGTSYNFAKLQKSEEVYTIKEGNKSNYYIASKTIEWNPNLVAMDSGTKLLRSPVTALCHEAGHAIQHDTAIIEGKVDEFVQSAALGSDKQYDTIADKEVITTTEQYAARHHGEISSEQVTRTGHSGMTAQIISINGQQVDISTKSQSWISQYVATYNRREK